MHDIIIVAVCFAVGLASPALGTSCGVNFAVMATLLPSAAVVPLHALLEGVSSATRWSLMREYVNYPFVLSFTLGGTIGMVAGWPLIGRFSDNELKVLLGVFFLLTVWAPLAWLRVGPRLGGATTSCLSVLVGATGPLVAAIIARREHDHRVVIGTQGAATTFQHWGKVLLFSASGFSFTTYLELMIALTLATFFGSWLGKRILVKSPLHLLRLALKAVVSILGLNLLLNGLSIRLDSVVIGSWTGGTVIAAVLALFSFIAYQVGTSTSQSKAPEQLSASNVHSVQDRGHAKKAHLRFMAIMKHDAQKSVQTENPVVDVVNQLRKRGFSILNHKMRYDRQRDLWIAKIYSQQQEAHVDVSSIRNRISGISSIVDIRVS